MCLYFVSQFGRCFFFFFFFFFVCLFCFVFFFFFFFLSLSSVYKANSCTENYADRRLKTKINTVLTQWYLFRITELNSNYPALCTTWENALMPYANSECPDECTVKLRFTRVYIFLFLLENIDCVYSLEPPRQGDSNENPQSMFWAEIWKISVFIWNFSVYRSEIFYTFE